MKSYTDINQSKKLEEILPIDSADMHYNNASIKGINYVDEHRAELMEYNRAIKVLSKYTINPLFEVIPCWSLAALLDVLPFPDLFYNDGWNLYVTINDKIININYVDSPIDACYELILKLKEKDLL